MDSISHKLSQLTSSVLFLMAASCFFFFLSWAYLRCSICSSSVSDDGKLRNTIFAKISLA